MPILSRRAFALSGVAATMALSSGRAVASAASSPRGELAGQSDLFVDLSTPMGNVEAYARIVGDTDPAATSYSWYAGRVSGQRPGEAARDLMRIIGMGTVRLLKRENGPGYMMLRKELGYFLDFETHEVIDRWENPYSGETVTVDHIANPSINIELKPYRGDIGLYEEVDKATSQPFLLNWTRVGDRVLTENYADLWVRNPLDPEIWKRESSGLMIAISDSNSFNVSWADLQNPALTKVSSYGQWVHRRPWQPWMLMGQAEGAISYICATGSAASLYDLPEQIVTLARERHPDFLEAPTEMTKGESSLARYMRTRTPAPPRERAE
ncbi:DUF1838 family protein [Altererythrobacter sp. GH1-8]|uniref:DUF1838 family protein n=1 Tax=Altererythrobacter sp. GH1-8 TaxID=3349333 RepID=UPI00374D1C9D